MQNIKNLDIVRELFRGKIERICLRVMPDNYGYWLFHIATRLNSYNKLRNDFVHTECFREKLDTVTINLI